MQQELMAKTCEQSDVVITTAQLFGRPAPTIITKEMVERMKPGSVIVDLAVESGGNVDGSVVGESVDVNGVLIVGGVNFVARFLSMPLICLRIMWSILLKPFGVRIHSTYLLKMKLFLAV